MKTLFLLVFQQTFLIFTLLFIFSGFVAREVISVYFVRISSLPNFTVKKELVRNSVKNLRSDHPLDVTDDDDDEDRRLVFLF